MAARPGMPPGAIASAARRNRRRRRRLVAATVAGLLAAALSAIGCAGGDRERRPGLMRGSPYPLQAEISSRVDSSGVLRPVVRVTVPYESLIYVRRGSEYVGGILVQVVARRDDRRVGGGVAQSSLVVADPEAPGSGELVCDVPLVIRGEDPVTLAVTATAQRSSRRWFRQLRIEPGNLSRAPLVMTSFAWNLAAFGAGGRLDRRHDALVVTVGFLARPRAVAAGVPVTLQATVVPAVGGEARSRRLAVPMPATTADTARVELRWPARDLPFGRADLELGLVLVGENETVVPCAPARSFVNLRVPWWNERAWRRHVGWLAGWTSDEQRERLLALDQASRAAAWDSVWLRAAAATGRSARTLEDEHLQRIVTADERFGRFGRGALSDRGRAWIRYGEPDRIEFEADPFGRETRWEIWYYQVQRVRLVFVDRNGLGDFQLVETSSY